MEKEIPPHCAICGIELTEHVSFFWWPMCESHQITARGLHEWVQQMCKRVFSEEEILKLAQNVVHFMREQAEEVR